MNGLMLSPTHHYMFQNKQLINKFPPLIKTSSSNSGLRSNYTKLQRLCAHLSIGPHLSIKLIDCPVYVLSIRLYTEVEIKLKVVMGYATFYRKLTRFFPPHFQSILCSKKTGLYIHIRH